MPAYGLAHVGHGPVRLWLLLFVKQTVEYSDIFSYFIWTKSIKTKLEKSCLIFTVYKLIL